MAFVKSVLRPAAIFSAVAAIASLAIAGSAQAPVSNPYPTGFPGQMPPSAAPPQAGMQAPQQGAANQTIGGSLPEGVKHLYAVEGDNSLIVVADSDGFATVRELVRNLSGDLDIIHTRIDAVDINADEQKALGIKINTESPAPSPELESRLINAWKHDRLRASCYPLRVVTRENTSVDVMLETRQHRTKTRLSFVPRIAKDGRLIVEVMEPVSVMAAAPSGDTLVVTMPGRSEDSARLLFITPSEGR